MRRGGILALTVLVAVWGFIVYPGAAERQSAAPSPADPGPTMVRVGQTVIGVGNRAFMATWSVAGGRFRPAPFEDRLGSRKLRMSGEVFTITLDGGRTLAASEMKLTGPPKVEVFEGEPKGRRPAERIPGKSLVVGLVSADGSISASWKAQVRDGATYVRQELVLQARDGSLDVSRVDLVDAEIPDARVAGTVPGSPVVSGDTFIGIEHPMSKCVVDGFIARCGIELSVPAEAGGSYAAASVIGVAPPGQLRRGFLGYLERERVHAPRTLLHYDSWYDLGYANRIEEKAGLETVDALGRELVTKRSVKIDSFLLADGWDDLERPWQFHDGFPSGLGPFARLAKKHGASSGIRISARGWQGGDRAERLGRFRQVLLDLVRAQGVSQLKIDGLCGGADFLVDLDATGCVEAATELLGDVRSASPGVYLTAAAGSWPSPFWLRHVDSVWRGGADHDFEGEGSDRQRWITYRDAATFRNVVQGAPLFPLSSLMVTGIVYARDARRLDADPGGDFVTEVRSYFGSGVQLQELHVTPSLLGERDWEVLAEAARWARASRAVLDDAHWVGGDPSRLEVYGWAAWSEKKAVLVLRNPSSRSSSLPVDIEAALELPAGQPRGWSGRSPWREDRSRAALEFEAGVPREIELRPFQVLALELQPLPEEPKL